MQDKIKIFHSKLEQRLKFENAIEKNAKGMYNDRNHRIKKELWDKLYNTYNNTELKKDNKLLDELWAETGNRLTEEQRDIMNKEWIDLPEKERFYKRHFEIDDKRTENLEVNQQSVAYVNVDDLTWNSIFQNAHLFQIDKLLEAAKNNFDNSLPNIIDRCCEYKLMRLLKAENKFENKIDKEEKNINIKNTNVNNNNNTKQKDLLELWQELLGRNEFYRLKELLDQSNLSDLSKKLEKTGILTQSDLNSNLISNISKEISQQIKTLNSKLKKKIGLIFLFDPILLDAWMNENQGKEFIKDYIVAYSVTNVKIEYKLFDFWESIYESKLDLIKFMLKFANGMLQCPDLDKDLAASTFEFAVYVYSKALGIVDNEKIIFTDKSNNKNNNVISSKLVEDIVASIKSLKESINDSEAYEKIVNSYNAGWRNIFRLMSRIEDKEKKNKAIFDLLKLLPYQAINYLDSDFLRENLNNEAIQKRLKYLSSEYLIKSLCNKSNQNNLQPDANQYYLKLIELGPDEIINYIDFDVLINDLDNYLVKSKLRFVTNKQNIQKIYNKINKSNINEINNQESEKKLSKFLNICPQLIKVFNNNDFELLSDQIIEKNIFVLEICKEILPFSSLREQNQFKDYVLNMQDRNKRKKLIDILQSYLGDDYLIKFLDVSYGVAGCFSEVSYGRDKTLRYLTLNDFYKEFKENGKYLYDLDEAYKLFYVKLALTIVLALFALLVIGLVFIIPSSINISIFLFVMFTAFWLFPLLDVIYQFTNIGKDEIISTLDKFFTRDYELKLNIYEECKNKCNAQIDTIFFRFVSELQNYCFKDHCEITNDMKKFFDDKDLNEIADIEIKYYLGYANNLIFRNLNEYVKLFINDNLLDNLLSDIKKAVKDELLSQQKPDDFAQIKIYQDVIDEYFGHKERLKNIIEIKFKKKYVNELQKDDTNTQKTLVDIIKEKIKSSSNQLQNENIIEKKPMSENANENEINTSSQN